jgi:hypothetical protein
MKNIDAFKTMKKADFANFGVPVVAYVRRVELGGFTAYALHGADGEPLGIEVSEDLAALAARQHNLMPVMVQ